MSQIQLTNLIKEEIWLLMLTSHDPVRLARNPKVIRYDVCRKTISAHQNYIHYNYGQIICEFILYSFLLFSPLFTSLFDHNNILYSLTGIVFKYFLFTK